MTCILAIDSAIGISSVAVRENGKTLATLENREPGMQASRLLPLIEHTLERAGRSYADLTHIAATVGPGSFTGIRIGLASARGIALAANLPCLGYTTLAVMAQAVDPSNTLAIINAGKGEVFYQYFSQGGHSGAAIGKLADILALYPEAKLACSVALPPGVSRPVFARHPRADALAELAETAPERASAPSPFYIRPPDAKPQILSSRA